MKKQENQENSIRTESRYDKGHNWWLCLVGLILFCTFLGLPKGALAHDFKIQRGSTVIGAGSSSATATAPADFEAVFSLSNAFVRIVSTQSSGTGDGTETPANTTIPPNEITATAVFTDTFTITFTRSTTSRDGRFYWEIWEYIGPSGGINEFIVRGQGESDAFITTFDDEAVAGVIDQNDCVVFLTGVQNSSAAVADYWAHTFHAYMLNATTARIERQAAGASVKGSYAVVEFTGINWNVQEGTHTFTAAGVAETQTITAVSATDKAFLISQHMTQENGLDDYGYRAWISATNEVSFQLRSTADVPANHVVRFWVVENSAPDFVVRRGGFTITDSASDDEQIWNQAITAVADLGNTALTFKHDTNGGGTAFPRAARIARLTSTTNLEVYTSRGNQPSDCRYETIEFTKRPVTRIGNWTTGLTHTVGGSVDTDRVLFFIAGYEDNKANDITAVTYGGQTLTPVVEAVVGTAFTARNEIWYLDEAGIQAATGNTFIVTYGAGAPLRTPYYAAATFQNVDQTSPILDSASNTTPNPTPNPIEATVNVLEGGMAIAGATNGNTGAYSWGNGWNAGPDQGGDSSEMATAEHAAAIDGTDTASATHAGSLRQVIVVTSLAPAVCHGKFIYRRLLTIDATRVGGSSGSHADFPVLVSIQNDNDLRTRANGGHVYDSNGYDIIFRAANGVTQLDHEIEQYDGTSGTLVAWVRVPSLSKGTNTDFYMYYGNCGVATDTQNATAVWDPNYVAVWHLNETVTDEVTTGTHADSTSYNNDGSQNNNDDAPGMIAGGQDFDGTNDYVVVPNDDTLRPTSALTLSGWINLRTFGTGSDVEAIIRKGEGNPNDYQLSIGDSRVGLYLEQGDGTGQGATVLSASTWYYVVGTWQTGGQRIVYLNGNQDGTGPDVGSIVPDLRALYLGGRAGADYSDGVVDELRISDILRPADWILTSYNNQSQPLKDTACTNNGFICMGNEAFGPTTAVDLLSFTAKGESGSVLVAWETAQELNHMGFHLYRARSPWGPFTRLTDKVISGLTSSVVGREYSFEDKDVTPGEIYYYKLEDVDIYGQKTFHGPICVDWDGDGLPDDWEIAHGLNPGFDDADLDWDGDGLTNWDEYLRGTDPFNPDTDGDGILDGDESIERDLDDDGEVRTLSRGFYLVESDETGATLELRTDSFDFTVVQADGQEFERLRIKEYIHGFTDAVGKPELPLKGILLDIPEGNAATVTVLETEDEIHSGYRVYPVPENTVEEQDQLAHVGELFVIDEVAYSVDAFYPEPPASLGNEYVFRGQQKQQIFFYPLTFNPATGEIRHYTRIRVRVDYVAAAAAQTSGPEPEVWSPPVINESSSGLSFMAGMASWEPPSGASPAYKIFVSGEGIYRLTKTWLEAEGVDVNGIDLSQVRVYSLGQEMAISVTDQDGDTQFDPEDYIDFYGRSVESSYAKYATQNVYWLTLAGGVGAPRRMAAIDSTPASGSVPSTHTFSVHHEEDRKYWAKAPGGDSLDRYFFDPYLYGEDIFYPGAGDPVSFNLFLPGVPVNGKGTLKIMMAGTWAPYHQVAVSVNGTSLGTYSWNDIAFYLATIEGVDLLDGNNIVSLECLTGVDAIAVDWFEATYPRTFQANGDTLTFSHDTGYRFQVSDFGTNNLLAFDITSPGNVDRVVNFQIIDTGGPGPYTLDFEPPIESGERTYLVLTSDQVKIPVAISKDDYGNLANPAIGADYLLITHRDLGWDGNGDHHPWLSNLVTLRQGQGLRVKVVDVEDVFDEFSYGISAPQAILDFLAHAYTSWVPPAPQYVLLVGDSSRNPKNNPDPTYGLDTVTTYLPTYLTFTEHMGETATDQWFVRVSGDDELSDFYLGRLPAKSAGEATTMVNKILAYEGSLNTKSWEKNVLLLADDQGDGAQYEYEANFEIMNNDVAALLPAAMNDPFKGYLNDYFDADDLSAEILALLNSGTFMVNYSGHSSIQILANHKVNYENIFNNSDVATLTNSNMYPFFISMGCLSGHFVYPEDWNYPSLAEALLRAEDKGAAAALMSTGLTTTEGQHILNTALFDAVFNQDVRVLGQAVSAAKQTLMANGDSLYEEVNETFLLFGDPAMTLKVPLPHRPQGLSAQGNTTDVALSWNAATDCNGGAVSGYNLYRSTTPGGNYTKVNTAIISGTQYDDTSVSPGTTYYYVVTSVDPDNGDESVHSQEASGGTQNAEPPASESESSGGGGGGSCFINTAAGE